MRTGRGRSACTVASARCSPTNASSASVGSRGPGLVRLGRSFPRGDVVSVTPATFDTTAKDGPGFGDAGHWWDVAVPEVGDTARLRDAYKTYLENAARARLVN